MGDVFSMLIGYVLGLLCAVVAYNNRFDELTEKIQKTKELLKECRNAMNDDEYWVQCDLIKQIDELLGEE